MTVDEWRHSFTLVRQIDPLQAIVQKGGHFSLRTYQVETMPRGDFTIFPVPHDVYQYTVRVKPGMEQEAANGLLRLPGCHGYSSNGDVLHAVASITPRKYRYPGSIQAPPTEEDVEALPGVLKCVRIGPQHRGQRMSYSRQQGDLVYRRERR